MHGLIRLQCMGIGIIFFSSDINFLWKKKTHLFWVLDLVLCQHFHHNISFWDVEYKKCKQWKILTIPRRFLYIYIGQLVIELRIDLVFLKLINKKSLVNLSDFVNKLSGLCVPLWPVGRFQSYFGLIGKVV